MPDSRCSGASTSFHGRIPPLAGWFPRVKRGDNSCHAKASNYGEAQAHALRDHRVEGEDGPALRPSSRGGQGCVLGGLRLEAASRPQTLSQLSGAGWPRAGVACHLLATHRTAPPSTREAPTGTCHFFWPQSQILLKRMTAFAYAQDAQFHGEVSKVK